MSSVKYNLTAAVLGTGYMGHQYIDIFSDLVSKVTVCAADEYGRKLAKERNLMFYSDYKELIATERPNIVAICLPTPLHYPATMCAFENGAHVICEKPFAANTDKAREMIAASRAKGLTLMIGHLIRFSGYYQFLKQCIDDGRFGKLKSLELFRHHPKPTWSVDNWLEDVSKSGGIIKDLHIHDTDAIQWMLGMPLSVYSVGNLQSCTTIYKYDNDVTATASASWRNADFSPSHGYDAVFENASISYDFDKFSLTGIPADIAISGGDLLQKELTHFCECVVNGTESEICPPEASFNSLVINEAEAASLHLGKTVQL